MLGEGGGSAPHWHRVGGGLVETSPALHYLDKSHCFQVGVKAQLTAGSCWHYPTESTIFCRGWDEGDDERASPYHPAKTTQQRESKCCLLLLGREWETWSLIYPANTTGWRNLSTVTCFLGVRCLLISGYSRVDSVKKKSLLLLGYPSPSHLAKENGLFLGPVLSVIGDFRLEAFTVANSGYMGQ